MVYLLQVINFLTDGIKLIFDNFIIAEHRSKMCTVHAAIVIRERRELILIDIKKADARGSELPPCIIPTTIVK